MTTPYATPGVELVPSGHCEMIRCRIECHAHCAQVDIPDWHRGRRERWRSEKLDDTCVSVAHTPLQTLFHNEQRGRPKEVITPSLKRGMALLHRCGVLTADV
jgi:hypothetical protein